MLAAEFRQEQKLAEIAALVASRPPSHRVRVIAIAGPTSSGKTTFSHKLCAYLKNHGALHDSSSFHNHFLVLNPFHRHRIAAAVGRPLLLRA
jgi:uridine kinase